MVSEGRRGTNDFKTSEGMTPDVHINSVIDACAAMRTDCRICMRRNHAVRLYALTVKFTVMSAYLRLYPDDNRQRYYGVFSMTFSPKRYSPR